MTTDNSHCQGVDWLEWCGQVDGLVVELLLLEEVEARVGAVVVALTQTHLRGVDARDVALVAWDGRFSHRSLVSWGVHRVVKFCPKWVRLPSKGTHPGPFQIRFQYILARRAYIKYGFSTKRQIIPM